MEVFEYASQGKKSSRTKYTRLKVGPSVWKKSLSSMKRNISLNTLKHDVKKDLQELRM